MRPDFKTQIMFDSELILVAIVITPYCLQISISACKLVIFYYVLTLCSIDCPLRVSEVLQAQLDFKERVGLDYLDQR